MQLLLDSHAFLWFVTADQRLSSAARKAIEDGGNERFLSIASVWEMAIKQSIKKLSFAEPFRQFILRETTGNRIDLLPITLDHAMAVAFLPMHHKDPFDRMIVAQANAESLVVVSSDEMLDRYGVKRIW